MRSLIVFTLALLSTAVVAQKPKKTFDHEKFGKKVVMSMADILIAKVCADEQGLQYIATQSGRSVEELTAERDANIEQLKEDIKFLDDNGVLRILDKVELKVIEETPVKKANILLYCHYKKSEYVLTLTNCIQTNTTWVMGDHIEPSGAGIEELVARYEEKKAKAENGVFAQIQDIADEQEAREAAAIAEMEAYEKAHPKSSGYHGFTYPQQGTDEASRYYHFDKTGQAIKGYYITENNQRIEAVIAYQEIEKLLLPEFDLVLCKEASTNLVDYLNPDSEANYQGMVKKADIRAFSVADQLFVKAEGKWYILMHEGAINELVSVQKLQIGGQTSYKSARLLHKAGQSPTNRGGMMIGFKNAMSQLVSDHTEMANGIRNAEPGYTYNDLEELRRDYNHWYEVNHKDKLNYLLNPAFQTTSMGRDK